MTTITGCSQVGYYLQAANGQLQLLSKRQPITQIIENPKTEQGLRKKLQLARDVRQFAIAEMDFHGNPGFTQYADVGRRYAVWNVVAAPAYSVEPKIWCFPIAGCVAYKGYFSEDRAKREQTLLLQQGYDVLVYGVAAYSTLGWFDDPLLNTYINYADADLAALIFHEITHQVVYVQDDSEFNEAFATAVELALLDRWLSTNGDPKTIITIRDNRRKQARITELILDYREQLKLAYQGDNPKAAKQQLFNAMKSDYQQISETGEGTKYFDWWFSRTLNNADLLTVSTYYRLVPAFTNLISAHQNDLPSFFKATKKLADMEKPQRDRALKELL